MSYPSEEKNSDNDNHSQAFSDFPDFLNIRIQIMQHLKNIMVRRDLFINNF